MSTFEVSEYRARVARAQALMAEADLAALLLTTEPEVRYFSGYLTRFWESPSRPWFLVVPAGGDPVAVIPEIGAPLMARGWIEDIRTWRSPQPEDEGISLLSQTLGELVGPQGRIGMPMGPETHLRLPLDDLARLGNALGDRQLGPDAGIIQRLRMVKSEAEIGCMIWRALATRLETVSLDRTRALSSACAWSNPRPRLAVSAPPARWPTAPLAGSAKLPAWGYHLQRSFADFRCWRWMKGPIGCHISRALRGPMVMRM